MGREIERERDPKRKRDFKNYAENLKAKTGGQILPTELHSVGCGFQSPLQVPDVAPTSPPEIIQLKLFYYYSMLMSYLEPKQDPQLPVP